ncbi:MAG: hypothetical protein MJA29_10575, partial [Candidatus Omnitrophica bacterium]|nr:hypothetical protein [Candidatus Omnitrophota bacterium]
MFVEPAEIPVRQVLERAGGLARQGQQPHAARLDPAVLQFPVLQRFRQANRHALRRPGRGSLHAVLPGFASLRLVSLDQQMGVRAEEP